MAKTPDAQELSEKIGKLLQDAGADPIVGADAIYLSAANITVALNLEVDNMVQRIGYFFWLRMMDKHKTNQQIVERGELEILKRKVQNMQALIGNSNLS